MKLERISVSNDGYEYLSEMAEVRRAELGGTVYRFLVFGDEGENIPHFYLHPLGGKKSDEICIRIDKPEYFIHGVYTKTLNTKERKDLRRILSEEDEGITFWDLIRCNWNGMHPDSRVSPGMPDYRKLPDKK